MHWPLCDVDRPIDSSLTSLCGLWLTPLFCLSYVIGDIEEAERASPQLMSDTARMATQVCPQSCHSQHYHNGLL